MVKQSKKTEPFVSNSIGDVLNQITAHVCEGYFHYSVLRSPDGSSAFDLDVVEEIERIILGARNAGISHQVQYLRIGKSALLLSTLASFFGPQSRFGDIRETPIDFDGYQITWQETEVRGVYGTKIEISPDFMEMHALAYPRVARKESGATVANAIRKLLEFRSPEIITQVETIFLAVNKARKEAGLELVSRAEAGLPEAVVLPIASA
jgi:hypothetical protein